MKNTFSNRFLTSKREKQNKKISKRKAYLLNENTPFDVTEAFRNLKSSISVCVPKNRKGGVSILATSSYPEDGKTTITTNLSLMFAQSDAKVVLVDADIRKGRIAKYFNKKSEPGLSDLLSGHATLDEVLHQSQINENLYIIPCGTHSPKPYELLESDAMKAVNEQLKERFDYVFFDTPPVLVVSDALALAPSMEGTILVTRHLVSYVSDIARSLNTLRFAKANVLGIIVNDYHVKEDKSYGGYKKYGYGYGYSDEPTQKND
ncbi:MAG: CpsD/CapB family tyrosine-protein kinase [Clostridia bacterium]|nr:CpsD/CapB family tyrosine-protein kinase [Clostridia bacterium]